MAFLQHIIIFYYIERFFYLLTFTFVSVFYCFFILRSILSPCLSLRFSSKTSIYFVMKVDWPVVNIDSIWHYIECVLKATEGGGGECLKIGCWAFICGCSNTLTPTQQMIEFSLSASSKSSIFSFIIIALCCLLFGWCTLWWWWWWWW